MLVLSRYPTESIRINDNVVVTVLEVRGNKVRLEIDAPKEVPVYRMELHKRIAGLPSRPPPLSSLLPAVTPPGLATGEGRSS